MTQIPLPEKYRLHNIFQLPLTPLPLPFSIPSSYRTFLKAKDRVVAKLKRALRAWGRGGVAPLLSFGTGEGGVWMSCECRRCELCRTKSSH
ncbi:hypothetical protein CDAR_442311 [Caerostris darwini]|uniref:Uncharacterized protein n=1 Tax=Caerostris darwini TaxID=1538125 RepID=A0AAV4V0J9_9ARAC|nr:hypothetical protein CDAR_442311 [Caerostris darwini]